MSRAQALRLSLEEAEEDPMQQVLDCSVSYRIAVGPQQGRKVFTLHKIVRSNFGRESVAAAALQLWGEAQGCAEQTIPAWEEDNRFSQTAKESEFSLHAGVAAQAWERSKLERLCRYITRPAISKKRLSMTSSGNIRYKLKTSYSDGTTHVILLRASCPPPFGSAVGCSKSLPAI